MDDSPFNTVLNLPAWLISGLFLFSVAAYFQFRSGSSFGVVNRLYALLNGGSDFHDPKLQQFWQDRKDIERFNALFHMKAKTVQEIQWFQNRVRKNKLDVKLFARMRGGFDSQRRKVKKIFPWLLAIPGLLLIGTVTALLPIYLVASSDGAILKLKGETQWITIQDNSFSSFSYFEYPGDKDWMFKASACQSLNKPELVTRTGLAESSITSICASFDSYESFLYFNKVLKGQELFWYLLLLYIFISVLIARQITSVIHTIRARSKLYEALIKARRDRILLNS